LLCRKLSEENGRRKIVFICAFKDFREYEQQLSSYTAQCEVLENDKFEQELKVRCQKRINLI
jgi:hypothetical protein